MMMTPEQFELFMKEQAEFFRQLHGDCKELTMQEISEDSLEFRRRWSKSHDDSNNDIASK